MVSRDRPVLAGTVFVVLFAQVLLYPGVDELVGSLGGGGRLDASTWFLAAEFAGFVLFASVWGAMSDALGRRAPLVTAGALGGAAGYAALALSAGQLPFAVVLLVRFVQGAFTIGAFSLAMTMLLDLDGGNGRNMGWVGIAIGAGTALGAPVGGVLYARGTLVPVGVAALSLAVAGLLVLVATERVGPGIDDPTAGRTVAGVTAALAVLRERPQLGVPYAFGFLDRLTAGFFALVGTFYFREVLGLSPALTGLVLGAFFAPFAVLQYPMGLLSDRIGRRLPIAIGSACYGVVVVGVVLAPTLALVVVAMVLVGVMGAFMSPATLALVGDLAGDGRGVAIGGYNVVGSLGFLVGIVGGGALASTVGYTVAFAVVGLSEVALALVALPALSRVEREVVRSRMFGAD